MMMHTTKVLVLMSVMMTGVVAVALADEDIASYSIPLDAKKIGPLATRFHDQVCYNYFLPNKETSPETLIGCETFYRNILIKRELFRNEKSHGVQREWFTNGQERLEAPYKDGVMNGVFKHWNEKGDLVAQYELRNGSGTVRIYDSKGRLIKNFNYKDNVRNGIAMEVSGENVWSLNWYVNGKLSGKGFDFFNNGNLKLITWLSDSEANGPMIEFSDAGKVVKSKWHLKSREVPEDNYVKAAKSDHDLAPHHADVNKYKDFVDEDVRKLIQNYLRMPRVKIPLEFDAKGDPVPEQ